ncbi:hypothetical protein ABEB36_009615 [Hypothenemus hampei]|uniref:Uncharacterized protein n=1 Tax=Hypothenemus hampei TaxID=57062 RepID=A0ABD1EGW5_HYPHA
MGVVWLLATGNEISTWQAVLLEFFGLRHYLLVMQKATRRGDVGGLVPREAEAIFEYVCSLLGVVREEILNWPGIPLGVLEEKFFTAVGDPGVLVKVGIWTFGRLLEMSPGIIVHEGRCYLVGVDEDSSSDDSDYFVVDDSSSEDSDYFSE